MGVSASAIAEIGGAGEADQHKVVLVADRVSKAFPGVLALDEVSLEVRSGEVNALVGENGAGKSTLIKRMAGFYAPDSGDIRIGGQLLLPDPAAAHEAGIATIHQDHHLIPSMTVAENLLLGRWPTRFGVLSRASMLRQAETVLDQVDSRYFGAVYDPANYVFCGFDPWEAWQTTKPWTIHFHIKDYSRETLTVSFASADTCLTAVQVVPRRNAQAPCR